MGKHENYEPPYLDETVIVDLAIFPGIDHIYRIGDGTIHHDYSSERRNKHRLTAGYADNPRVRFFNFRGQLETMTRVVAETERFIEVGDPWKKPR